MPSEAISAGSRTALAKAFCVDQPVGSEPRADLGGREALGQHDRVGEVRPLARWARIAPGDWAAESAYSPARSEPSSPRRRAIHSTARALRTSPSRSS